MKPALALAAYAGVLRLLTPLFLLRLWWRGRREPGYRAQLAGRLGFGPPQPPGRLWLHAVSLGETRAAAPLVAALRARDPGLRLLLTHGTATGREAGRALLRDGDVQAWLPWDTPGSVRRFLARHRPSALVVMETEVWPVLLAECTRAGVPRMLANARLSPKSERQGRRFASLLHPALARFDLVLAQAEADAARLRASGAQAVQVAGNLKFDIEPAQALLERGRAWKQRCARPVVLAAVWRDGEDEPLLDAWRTALRGLATLVIVPRHPQRFDAVTALAADAGYRTSRRSAWGEGGGPGAALHDAAMDEDAEVWIGDTLGEMPAWYTLADLALLGGSFAPLGGQNLIEAAACGCPVLMGPHTFNFAHAADEAEAAGAARRVPDIAAAVQAARELLADAPARERMAAAGLAFAAAHRGAAARMADAVIARRDAGGPAPRLSGPAGA